LSSNHEV